MTQRFWTLNEIRTKIKRDLDLEAELFVRPEELDDYINEGVDICESTIHNLYEDYFLAEAFIDLVQGQRDFALPTNMYADKIRQLVYDSGNGGTIYQVPRLRSKDYLELERLSLNYDTTDFYRYYLLNSTQGSGPILRLIPAARETAPQRLVIHYIRNANRLVDDDDVCDIPEFVYFVIQYAKMRIYEKEKDPAYMEAAAKLEKLEQRMNDTLMNRHPDGNTTMEMDLGFYEESS